MTQSQQNKANRDTQPDARHNRKKTLPSSLA